jgi:hypothetical protein
MRIFESPNLEGFICPICGTGDDRPVTLVGISDTEQGNNIQAQQVHVECLELRITPMQGTDIMIIYHAFENLEEK